MSITLAGQSLPDPQLFQVSTIYRGGSTIMADGTTSFDLVDSTAKKQFSLGWKALTTAQMATLSTAWASLKTATGSLVFVAPSAPDLAYYSGTYTVTRSSTSPDLVQTGFPFPGGARWSVNIVLIED